MSKLDWIFYVVFTILVNITCMNLLIAILSNTYDNVQTSLDATNCKTKAEILHEISGIYFWKRSENELYYLHLVNYTNEKIKGGVDEWVGRVRVIINKLDDLKE